MPMSGLDLLHYARIFSGREQSRIYRIGCDKFWLSEQRIGPDGREKKKPEVCVKQPAADWFSVCNGSYLHVSCVLFVQAAISQFRSENNEITIR